MSLPASSARSRPGTGGLSSKVAGLKFMQRAAARPAAHGDDGAKHAWGQRGPAVSASAPASPPPAGSTALSQASASTATDTNTNTNTSAAPASSADEWVLPTAAEAVRRAQRACAARTRAVVEYDDQWRRWELDLGEPDGGGQSAEEEEGAEQQVGPHAPAPADAGAAAHAGDIKSGHKDESNSGVKQGRETNLRGGQPGRRTFGAVNGRTEHGGGSRRRSTRSGSGSVDDDGDSLDLQNDSDSSSNSNSDFKSDSDSAPTHPLGPPKGTTSDKRPTPSGTTSRVRPDRAKRQDRPPQDSDRSPPSAAAATKNTTTMSGQGTLQKPPGAGASLSTARKAPAKRPKSEQNPPSTTARKRLRPKRERE